MCSCEWTQTYQDIRANEQLHTPGGELPLIYEGGWGLKVKGLFGFRVSFFKLVYFLGYKFESFVPRQLSIYFKKSLRKTVSKA